MFTGVRSSFAWLFTGLDGVLGRVERKGRVYHVMWHTHLSYLRPPTTGGETERSEPWRVRSKRTYRIKKCGSRWTGPLLCDWGDRCIKKARSFLLSICRKDVSVSTRDPTPFLGSGEPRTFPGINVFVWKLQVGGSMDMMANPWDRKRLSGSGSGSWVLHNWWGTKYPFS